MRTPSSFIRRTFALCALVLATGSCDDAHRLIGPSAAVLNQTPQLDSVAPAAQTGNAYAYKVSPTVVNATLEGIGYYDGGGAAWFQYGADSTLASPSTTPLDSVTFGSSRLHQADVGPLVRDAIYYFRLVVRTPQGTRMGAIRRFRAGAPDAPTEFSLVAVDSLNYLVDLAWSHDGNNVRSWAILRRPAGQATWVKTGQIGARARTARASVPNPLAGGAYEYRVLACNYWWCGESAVVAAQLPPLPPATQVTATPVSSRIQLTWHKEPYGGLVRLYRRPSTTEAFSLLASVPHTQTAYADTAVTIGTTYLYRVRVCTLETACVDSDVAGATAGGEPGITPGLITGGLTALMKMADGSGRVQATLHGTVVTNGLDGTAWMEYGTDPALAGAASTPAVPVPGSSASVPVTRGVDALARDQVYYYRLVAQADSVRYAGQIRSFRAGAPDAPTSFSAVFSLPAWYVPLQWAHDGGGDPQVFPIERRRPGEAWVQIVRAAAVGRNTSDLAFSPRTVHTFEYRISACNRIACSPPVPAGAGPVHTPALLPAQLTAAAEGTGARLQWQNQTQAAHAQFVHRSSAGSTHIHHLGSSYPAPVTGSFLLSLPPGTHVFSLEQCVRGECVTSEEASVTLGATGSAPVAVTSGHSRFVDKMPDGSGRMTAGVLGTVDANGLPTDTWAEYGLSPSLAGAASSDTASAGYDTVPRPVAMSITALLRDTVYYFRVHARNSAGTSAGVIHSVWTGPPGPVANLTASVNTERGYVRLQWVDAFDDVASWLVERRVPGGAWAKAGQALSGTTFFDFGAGAWRGATLEYRVSACTPIMCSVPVQISVPVP